MPKLVARHGRQPLRGADAPEPAGLSFSGRSVTGPNTSTYYGEYGKTDAAGLYQYDTTPTAITPYSSCRFTTTVDGNYVSTSRTLAP